MSTQKTIKGYSEEEILESVCSVLKDRLKPLRIYLFGSRGEGTARIQSDFDIAVVGDHPYSLTEMREAKEKLEEQMGIYSYDLIDLRKSKKDFRRHVKQTGQLIYERD